MLLACQLDAIFKIKWRIKYSVMDWCSQNAWSCCRNPIDPFLTKTRPRLSPLFLSYLHRPLRTWQWHRDRLRAFDRLPKFFPNLTHERFVHELTPHTRHHTAEPSLTSAVWELDAHTHSFYLHNTASMRWSWPDVVAHILPAFIDYSFSFFLFIYQPSILIFLQIKRCVDNNTYGEYSLHAECFVFLVPTMLCTIACCVLQCLCQQHFCRSWL